MEVRFYPIEVPHRMNPEDAGYAVVADSDDFQDPQGDLDIGLWQRLHYFNLRPSILGANMHYTGA